MNSLNPLAKEKLVAISEYHPRLGPLADVNRDFHQTYEQLVGDVLSKLGHEYPVMMAIDDELKLFDSGVERAERFIPEAYHQLKAICHVAFGVQLALAYNGDGPLNEATARQLQAKTALIQTAEQHIHEENFSEDVHDSSVEILRLCRLFVEGVLNAASVDSSAVAGFARDVGPQLKRNIGCATRLELNRLHEVVTLWRGELGTVKWRATYVVICEGHQPRYRQATKQYFQRLLHEDDGSAAELEDRVIYAEGVSDVAAAIDLLARHMIDQDASRIFFGDRRRLQEDLLADAATHYLNELLPNARSFDSRNNAP